MGQDIWKPQLVSHTCLVQCSEDLGVRKSLEGLNRRLYLVGLTFADSTLCRPSILKVFLRCLA